jgi:hypothetical protein
MIDQSGESVVFVERSFIPVNVLSGLLVETRSHAVLKVALWCHGMLIYVFIYDRCK